MTIAPNTPTPSFPKADPAAPEFWDMRFEAAFTPWDQGGIPNCLQQYVDALKLTSLATPEKRPSVLIPGCGSAYEVKLFADLHCDVTAIDFSHEAVLQARRILAELVTTGNGDLNKNVDFSSKVRQADFFSDAIGHERFDFVYERAFLCALPRRMWPNWAHQTAKIIPGGGHLVGFFFEDSNEKGPPFGLVPGELETMLLPYFVRTQFIRPTDSVPVFAGKETWQVWRRL